MLWGTPLSLPSQPRTTLGSPHPPGTCVGTRGFELQSTHVHDKHFNYGAMPRRLRLILKSLKEAWSVFEPIIPHTLGVHYLNEGNILKQCFIYLLSIRAPGEPFRIYCINLFSSVVLPSGSGGPLVFHCFHLCSYQVQVLYLGKTVSLKCVVSVCRGRRIQRPRNQPLVTWHCPEHPQVARGLATFKMQMD